MSKCYYCNRETTICFLDGKGHSFCSSQCKSAYIQETFDIMLKLKLKLKFGRQRSGVVMGKEKDIFEGWDEKTVHERRQMLANAFKQSYIHYMNQNALEDDKEVDVRVLEGKEIRDE